MLVQGDLETTMGHIKKGLVVQNNSYMPVQRNLDQIAKSIKKVESYLVSIAESMEKKDEIGNIENESANLNNSNEDER